MASLVRIGFTARRAWLAALLSLAAAAWPASGPSEYQVKAVFLFNFGQFVEWPASAFDSPESAFTICIVGEDPFGETLDEVVRGESVGARSLVVRRFKDAGEVSGCHILFIGRDGKRQLEAALAAVRGQSILTVTDVAGAENQGAIIVLINQSNRIRMRINLAEAKARQLVISSKLLRPAEVIGADAETGT